MAAWAADAADAAIDAMSGGDGRPPPVFRACVSVHTVPLPPPPINIQMASPRHATRAEGPRPEVGKDAQIHAKLLPIEVAYKPSFLSALSEWTEKAAAPTSPTSAAAAADGKPSSTADQASAVEIAVTTEISPPVRWRLRVDVHLDLPVILHARAVALPHARDATAEGVPTK